jgi:hypothetical protein
MMRVHIHRLPLVDAARKLVDVISPKDLARGVAGQEFEQEVALTLGATCHGRESSREVR